MIISQLLNLPFLRALPFSLTSKAAINSNSKTSSRDTGNVYLIGAGPGDAELLTLKAYRLLQQADIVLYDSLVNKEILQVLPSYAQAIFVGKRRGKHSMSQSDICQLMSEYALKGHDVIRLKGGDPAIFGRCAEETEHLQKCNIKFAIVPGVTAASGCSAWSGIPLTHRDQAHSVRFITAHFKSDSIQADWYNYATSNDTLVFYMGLSKIADIATNLIHYGKPQSTPMAIVDQGTTAHHVTYESTLGQISQTIEEIEIVGPALIIVGTVVAERANVSTELLRSVSIYE